MSIDASVTPASTSRSAVARSSGRTPFNSLKRMVFFSRDGACADAKEMRLIFAHRAAVQGAHARLAVTCRFTADRGYARPDSRSTLEPSAAGSDSADTAAIWNPHRLRPREFRP